MSMRRVFAEYRVRFLIEGDAWDDLTDERGDEIGDRLEDLMGNVQGVIETELEVMDAGLTVEVKD